jgi:hypothetical protein
MAHVYVRSGAGGAGTGADWANAYTTLAAALTAKAAGDNFWVSEDHAETAAGAKTLTSPGTAAAPCTVICVNHSGTVPPVSADIRTTATITTTGANAITISSGYAYFYGITFSSGSGAVTTSLIIGSGTAFDFYFKTCKLVKAGTTASASAISFAGTGGIAGQVILDNTTMKFGSTTDKVQISQGGLFWRNTASAIDAGGSTPTILCGINNAGPDVIFEGLDLSAITGTLRNITSFTNIRNLILKDCKLGSGVTVHSGSFGGPSHGETQLLRADSGTTNYRHERHNYMAVQTVETTIVLTGGASDGTTPFSWKIVTTANSKWQRPFESLPLRIWNTSTGSVTLTVQGIWGGGAVPNNDDIWMEVAYLAGTSSQTSIATNGKADYLATGAALSAGTGTWGGSTTKFALSATFTPGQAGTIVVTVKAAKASSTFYIDPKPVLT